MQYTRDQVDAIRHWTLSRLTLIVDNDESWVDQVTEAAQEAVTSHYDGWALDDYTESFNERGGMYSRYDYVDAVGQAVADKIVDLIDERDLSSVDPMRLLILDLLDLSDRELRDMIGDHYLPDPGDLVEE